MKFICDGLDLSDALNRVSKACAVRTTMSILECVKVTAYNDTVSLLASDGEISIRKKVTADIMEEGEICVPGKLFSDYVNKLVGETISIETNEKDMVIRYNEDNHLKLNVLSAEDFPKIDEDIKDNYFIIDNKYFKEMVAGTVFCCAQDESRPILKGCLIEIEEGIATTTSLDGFRMAVIRETIVEESGSLKIICPARTLSEITKFIENDEGVLKIYVKSGMMMVNIGETVITSRLYQGEFIRHEDITPNDYETETDVERQELIASIERAAIIIKSEKQNMIVFDIKNGYIKISSISEAGNMLEKVRCEQRGRELKIAMNSKYILEAVRSIREDQLTIKYNSPTSPFVISGKENSESYYLILPVRM